MHPRLYGARSIVLRTPFLLAVGQITVSRIELRRFIELAIWSVYFTEHPVEWACFQGSHREGYTKTIDSPIAYSAHRETGFYLNYAKERLNAEPSGIAARSVGLLVQQRNELNAAVHPDDIAISNRRLPPFEKPSAKELTKIAESLRSVYANAAVVLAAVGTKRFNSLPPMHRAHFDWLVGPRLEKEIRKSAFGLPDT
jgi:hypothetical protein